MALEDRSILVLYGTEMGNSQERAEEIDRMCQRLRFKTSLEEMDDCKLNDLLQGHDLVIFVLSTTGQGLFPANARSFWKSLRRAKLPPNCLDSVRFTTFGLGDSSYSKFNWASRLLNSRLLRLGAEEAFPRGEGDERHNDGIDSIYQPWIEDLRDFLLTEYPLPNSVQPIPKEQSLPPRYALKTVPRSLSPVEKMGRRIPPSIVPLNGDEGKFAETREKSAAQSHIDRPQSSLEQVDEEYDRQKRYKDGLFTAREEFGNAEKVLGGFRVDFLDRPNILKDTPEKYLIEKPPLPKTPPVFPSSLCLPIPTSIPAVVVSNVRVTPPDHWQDVRLLTLDIELNPLEFAEQAVKLSPGDCVGIAPKNYPEDVQKLIDIMDWGSHADVAVTFESQVPKRFYMAPHSTLREFLTHNVDFNAVPSRTFLEKLSEHATNADHKEKLIDLTRLDSTQEFYDFASRPRRTILEVLAEFYSAKIPWSLIPDLFPAIRIREYSIANGGQHWKDFANKSNGSSNGKSEAELNDEYSRRLSKGVHRVELLIALVEYKTIIRKPRQGLCSRYVKNLPSGTDMHITITRSSPPPSGLLPAQRPLIAIATGTGIAPLRSLIHDRAEFPASSETLLFFGCRNKDADFYFHEEWSKLAKVNVIPAFSRDPKPAGQPYLRSEQALDDKVGNNKDTDVRMKAGLPPLDAIATGLVSYNYDEDKTYVQHQIRRSADRLCRLLKQNPIISLCGSSGRMPLSVREALLDASIMGGCCKDKKEAEWLFDETNPNGIVIWQETW